MNHNSDSITWNFKWRNNLYTESFTNNQIVILQLFSSMLKSASAWYYSTTWIMFKKKIQDN